MNDPFGLSALALPLAGSAALVAVASALVAWSAASIAGTASRMAAHLGVSESVIGLTVIAAGTSAPEFAVTALAALEGHGDISVGNVVGSNIFNLGFILGTVALIRPVVTDRWLVWRDGGALVGGTLVLLLLVGIDLELGFLDGVILIALLAVYLRQLMRSGPRPPVAIEIEVPEKSAPERAGLLHPEVLKDGGRLLVSLVVIAVSAQALIVGAEGVARSLGLSDWIIAVTIVAAGTSLPEMATSLAAVLKGHHGISAGNIIGSDLFNILGVLGLAGLLNTVTIDAAARGALMALSGMVIVTVLFMRSGWKVSRGEGFVLFCIGALRWMMDLAGRGGAVGP